MAADPKADRVYQLRAWEGVVCISQEASLSKRKAQTVYMLQSDGRVVQRQTLGVGSKRSGSSNDICDKNNKRRGERGG